MLGDGDQLCFTSLTELPKLEQVKASFETAPCRRLSLIEHERLGSGLWTVDLV